MTDRGAPSTGTGDEVDQVYIVLGLLLITALAVFAGVAFNAVNIDVWVAILTFLFLVAASVPLYRAVARAEDAPWLFKMLIIGLILKLLVSLIRYFTIYKLYGGNGDAGVYQEAGELLAVRIRSGLSWTLESRMDSFPAESRSIAYVSGVVCYFTGSSYYAAFFVFSWFCYAGQLLVVRAVHVAVPEADFKRFARLIIFLPSLLFWPSSVGKESVMIFLLGLMTYGAALLLAPKPRWIGLAWCGAGIGLALLIRPHIALITIAGLIAAMAVSAVGGFGRGAGGNQAMRVLALVALFAAASVALTASASLFGKDATQGETSVTASSALSQTLAQTSIGGSEFHPVAANNPALLPFAVISVLIRPFPWEAHNANSLIAAGEGALLGAFFVLGWRRLLTIPKMAMRRPFLVFVAVYVVAFSIGFSYIGNFGILARERTQMLPMVLVFLAIPPKTRRIRTKAGEARDEDRIDGSSMKDRALRPVGAPIEASYP